MSAGSLCDGDKRNKANFFNLKQIIPLPLLRVAVRLGKPHFYRKEISMFFLCVARSSFSAHDEFSRYVDENYANFIVFSRHKLQLNTCDGNGARKKRLVGWTADDKSDGTV